MASWFFPKRIHSISTENPQEPFEKKLTILEAKLDAMDSKMNILKLEWTEAYDKIHHALDRARKRDQAVAKKNPTSETEIEEPNHQQNLFVSHNELRRRFHAQNSSIS